MARSSVYESDSGTAGGSGHDIASLGPSDTSDSGSDMAGADGIDSDDSTLPVDIVLSRDGWHAGSTSQLRSDSDSSGTGEVGGAGGNGGVSAASDIRPDHIVAADRFEANAAADAGLDPDELLLSAMALDDSEDGIEEEITDMGESGILDDSDPRDPTLIPKVRRGSS